MIDEIRAKLILKASSSSTGARDRGSAKWFGEAGWGVRGGREDEDDLNEIIKAELIKTGNHGDSVCQTRFNFIQSIIKGLDEELAEAVDKKFFENYKQWKMDQPNPSTRQKVNLTHQT